MKAIEYATFGAPNTPRPGQTVLFHIKAWWQCEEKDFKTGQMGCVFNGEDMDHVLFELKRNNKAVKS